MGIRVEHPHSGRIDWIVVAGPALQPAPATVHIAQSDEGNGNRGRNQPGQERVKVCVAPGFDGALVVLARTGGGSGIAIAGQRRRARLLEPRKAPRVGDRVGPVADAGVGATGDRSDLAPCPAASRSSVVEVHRPVARRHEVDLGGHPAVGRTHVPDPVRTLLENPPVPPRGAQAFGVPGVHPFRAAALTGSGRFGKQQERSGEKRDCRYSCPANVSCGHFGASPPIHRAHPKGVLYRFRWGSSAAATRRIFLLER